MKKLLKQLKSKKGFTLVEVIVVLVILAILAAITIPSLTGYIDEANSRAVVTEARTAYAAVQTMASLEYGTKQSPSFFNGNGNGLSATGETKLDALTGFSFTDGSLTSIVRTNNTVTSFSYGNNGYTVTYSSTGGFVAKKN